MRAAPLMIVAVLLATPLVLAHGDWTHCGGIELLVTDGQYIVYDTVGPTAGWAWLYLESNGIQHLQRGVGPWGNDACQEVADADTGFLLY